ncbi:MAG: hypothetical protein QW716_04775 [Desulfurococcaceae archaeon]
MVIEINELVKEYEKLIDKLKIARTRSTVNIRNIDEALKTAEKTCLKTNELILELRGDKSRILVEKPTRVLIDYVFIIQIPYVLRLLNELKNIAIELGDSDTISKLDILINKFRALQES